MERKYDGPHFAYSNNGIDMVIPFHPRVYHLVEKVSLNSWAAIFTAALYNIAFEGEDRVNEREIIFNCLIGSDVDFGYDKSQVTADIARYLTDTHDLLKHNYSMSVGDYVTLAMNIPKVKETSQSGEYTIRKIIHYWLRTELSHLVLKSPHHTEWSTLSGLLSTQGVLLDAIWMETFGLYESEKPKDFSVTEPMFVAGNDVEVIVLGSQDSAISGGSDNGNAD